MELNICLLQELKERIERVRENSRRDGAAASESEFSEEMMEIRKEFVTIHGEMVLLKNYSSLNFAGKGCCISLSVVFTYRNTKNLGRLFHTCCLI